MSGIPDEMRLDMLIEEVQAAGPAALALFETIIARGETPEWAAMCALQQPPGASNTDRAFCEGQRERMDKISDVNKRALKERLRKKGFEPGNKFHVSGLGPVDDPNAWVSCADDVLAVAKAKNLDVQGAVRRKAVEKDPKKKDVPLANDIVRRIGQDYIAKDPVLAEKCRKSQKARQELKERIIATHGKPARKHK